MRLEEAFRWQSWLRYQKSEFWPLFLLAPLGIDLHLFIIDKSPVVNLAGVLIAVGSLPLERFLWCCFREREASISSPQKIPRKAVLKESVFIHCTGGALPTELKFQKQ